MQDTSVYLIGDIEYNVQRVFDSDTPLDEVVVKELQKELNN